MKRKIMLCSFLCFNLMFGQWPQSAIGTSVVKQYQIVEEITSDVDTWDKRHVAIDKLSTIVKDSTEDMRLREYAAAKLGDLGAMEAKDMLKTLAESLENNDATRDLKSITTRAYWQIRILEEPTKEAQENLLIKLLGMDAPPPHAGSVPNFAINELANRGVQRALPDIIQRIKNIYGEDKTGDEWTWLCKTKIELLSSSAGRFEALGKALAIEDPTQYQSLKKWSVEELGKLGTEDSRRVLINFAIGLQNEYYDVNGKRIKIEQDKLSSKAGDFYQEIIKILKNSGMSDSEIKSTGLCPDKFFLTPGGY